MRCACPYPSLWGCGGGAHETMYTVRGLNAATNLLRGTPGTLTLLAGQTKRPRLADICINAVQCMHPRVDDVLAAASTRSKFGFRNNRSTQCVPAACAPGHRPSPQYAPRCIRQRLRCLRHHCCILPMCHTGSALPADCVATWRHCVA